MKGLHWKNKNDQRTLIFNLTVPIVKKNVDLCLFDASPEQFVAGNNHQSCRHNPHSYIALGELKGGIDPAGADEHWKTAKTAIDRIIEGFNSENFKPLIFYIGAAIETKMASEIYNNLITDYIHNAANLTKPEHITSIADWLINI